MDTLRKHKELTGVEVCGWLWKEIGDSIDNQRHEDGRMRDHADTDTELGIARIELVVEEY